MEKPKQPRTKEIWSVEDSGRLDGPSVWTRVGTAFENKDGSFDVQMTAYPVHGRLHMRDPLLKEPEPMSETLAFQKVVEAARDVIEAAPAVFSPSEQRLSDALDDLDALVKK